MCQEEEPAGLWPWGSFRMSNPSSVHRGSHAHAPASLPRYKRERENSHQAGANNHQALAPLGLLPAHVTHTQKPETEHSEAPAARHALARRIHGSLSRSHVTMQAQPGCTGVVPPLSSRVWFVKTQTEPSGAATWQSPIAMPCTTYQPNSVLVLEVCPAHIVQCQVATPAIAQRLYP